MEQENVKMTTDVVCGKPAGDETRYTTTYGDRYYYFCSEKCERDFVSNPLRYVDKSQSASSQEGSPKILPSGQEVSSRS